MSLKLLVQLLEDEPGCGTRPPHRPPHPHADAALEAAAVPSYATRAMIVAAHDAVRLRQLGHSVGGALQQLLSEAADKLFDDYCGTVPLSELVRQLNLHWPPPPPSTWQSFVESLVAQYAVYAVAEKDHRFEKPQGILKTIQELIQEGLHHRITGGGPGSSGPHNPSVVIHLPLPPVPGPHFGTREAAPG